MATTALLSTVVMGAVLLGVLALVLRARHWQHPAPTFGIERPAVSRVNGPLGWSVAFVAVALLVTLLAMFYAGGEAVAGIENAAIGLGLWISLGLVISAAMVVAVYGTMKSRGLNNAQAAGVAATLFSVLFLVVVVVQLFVGG